jgi:hypothetical protein
MSSMGADLLRRVHGVAADKIDASRTDPERPATKDSSTSSAWHDVILTSACSPDRIEHVIGRAARGPEAARRRTSCWRHPPAREGAGRRGLPFMLESRAKRPGRGEHRPLRRFVAMTSWSSSSGERHLVTLYLNTEQITSGTLAYAVGSGGGGRLHAVPVRRRAAETARRAGAAARRRSHRPRSSTTFRTRLGRLGRRSPTVAR